MSKNIWSLFQNPCLVMDCDKTPQHRSQKGKGGEDTKKEKTWGLLADKSGCQNLLVSTMLTLEIISMATVLSYVSAWTVNLRVHS